MSARARLQPLDVSLKHYRGYTWLRRSFLAMSLFTVLFMPLWHLRAMDSEGAGLAGSGGWAKVARLLPLPSSMVGLVGPPGAIDVFGLELIDPLPVASAMLSKGASLQLVLIALPAVLLVVLLGRFFCGWVCPYVPLIAASNALRWLLTRVGVPLPDLKLPRRTSVMVLVGVLFASAVFGVQLAPLIYPPSLIGREAFRVIFAGGLGAGALVVLGAFSFDTFVSRAGFCRSLCPGGAMFSLLGAMSPVRVLREVKACTDCTVCDVVCNLGQKPMTSQLDEGCERCGKCVAACPTGALRIGLSKPVLLRPPGDRP